jgi:hypothetical protein
MLSKVAYGQAAKSAFFNMFGFLGFLCLIVTVPASADLRRDLPIGYQEITEVSPGQYRVLARCVETSALLESVAEKTGKPLVFDIPCNTYVSILHPDKTASLESWLDYIATLGACLECKLKADDAWHVYQLSNNPVYEPQLSETQAIAKFREYIRPSARSGIEKGLVFYHGVFFPPPYSISSISSSDGAVSVAINDVSVRKFSAVTTSVRQERAVPERPSSGQFEDEKELRDYVVYGLYPDYLSISSPKESQSAVIEFLKTQSLIEAVYEDEELSVMNFFVQYRGQPGKSLYFPINYDFELGSLRSTGNEARLGSNEKAVQSSLEDLTGLLSQDHVIFFAKSCQLVVPGSLAGSLAECMRLARDLPLLKAECILAEFVEDRALARDMAVNLSGNYSEAIAQVEAVQRRRDDLRDSESSSVGDGADIRDASPGLILGSVWCLASCTWRKVGTKV